MFFERPRLLSGSPLPTLLILILFKKSVQRRERKGGWVGQVGRQGEVHRFNAEAHIDWWITDSRHNIIDLL